MVAALSFFAVRSFYWTWFFISAFLFLYICFSILILLCFGLGITCLDHIRTELHTPSTPSNLRLSSIGGDWFSMDLIFVIIQFPL